MNKFRWIFRMLGWAWISAPLVAAAQNVESITLKQAVEKALRNSQDVTLAQLEYNVTINTVEVNRALFKPNLFTGSGAAYTYGFPTTPSGAAPSIVNLSYLQSVFNPLLTAQVAESRERNEEQRLELEKTRNAVMLQTISGYLELAKVRHSLDLMRNERESNTRILNFTRQRSAEGMELPIELTRAELADARIAEKVVQLESRQHSLENELAALMGVPAGTRIEVEPETLAFDENEREQDLEDRAVRNSLDLQQAESERKAREHHLHGEIETKWPTVDMFGEYGLFSTINNFQQYFLKFQQNNFNLGLQIKIPLFTGQRSANVSLARSQLTVAESQLKSKRQTLELDVANKIQRVRELDAAHEVARLELKLAQENLQLIQAKFEESQLNLRDVERARLDENEKWLALLDSDYDRQKAQLDLLNVTGNLGSLLH